MSDADPSGDCGSARRDATPPILIGAGGRVGQALRRAWTRQGRRALAVSHRAGPGIDAVWPTGARPPAMSAARTVIVLSGATPATGLPLSANVDLPLAAVDAARGSGARRILVASSSSVYGATGAAPATEDTPLDPRNDYAHAKAEMERALANAPDITILRLANVAGASEPFDSIASGRPLVLHRFADGHGPSRSFVGPATLADILWRLCAAETLPPILNIAAPPPVAMAEIFAAAGRRFDWAEAPPQAIRYLHLDTTALTRIVALNGTSAATLLAETAK